MTQIVPKLVWLLILLMVSCNGLSSESRSRGLDNSNGSKSGGDGSTNNSPRSGDIETSSLPVPIDGSNLTQVLVYAICDSQNSCKSLRFGANIKVGSEAPIRFAADTIDAFGIKKSSWKFSGIPSGVICESETAGLRFNPRCSSSGSFANSRIKATLTLVAANGSTVAGDSPDSDPLNDGTIIGNFMKLSASSGLVPSGITYSGASSAFTEIWQDLVSGNYLTNILYDGGGNPSGTDWSKSMSLCSSVGDGTGAGTWRRPTREELCGPGNPSNSDCNGGFYAHDIRNVTFAGGDWTEPIWSSSGPPGIPTYAFGVKLNGGIFTNNAKLNTNYGVVCVR